MLNAPNSHEEGRLVYKYGGEPIGSFCKSIDTQLRRSATPAMLTVMTHDNPCPLKVR